MNREQAIASLLQAAGGRGLTCHEIAEKLHIEPAKVGQSLKRLREHLRHMNSEQLQPHQARTKSRRISGRPSRIQRKTFPDSNKYFFIRKPFPTAERYSSVCHVQIIPSHRGSRCQTSQCPHSKKKRTQAPTQGMVGLAPRRTRLHARKSRRCHGRGAIRRCQIFQHGTRTEGIGMNWMLDICAGRLGWSKAFLSRGWSCVAIDLIEPSEIPARCYFLKVNLLAVGSISEICRRIGIARFDFGCASTPCEEFAVWGMRHFHPAPALPTMGLRLFNHAKALLEEAELPHVMENVRAAQNFVGPSLHHCGSFHL
jgi:hypothetical protein